MVKYSKLVYQFEGNNFQIAYLKICSIDLCHDTKLGHGFIRPAFDKQPGRGLGDDSEKKGLVGSLDQAFRMHRLSDGL